VVRASRTELDWAARQGHISVWAPSKMVLDAVHGPKGEVGDLVVWLAQEMSAVALLTLGDTPIDGAHALDLAGPCQLPAASK